MNTFPTSIEEHFNEAGFSGTEVLILKKLLDFDALTLRELAAKTGKSTGVLDQAMKKLLKKKVVVREMINGTPKYVLHSLETVRAWMKDDMKQKQQMIVRRYENFEAFIATVAKTKSKQRPEVDFFEGREGMKQAYMQLFERGRVFHQYGPTLWLAEEDPLRDFRVQFFRECRNRGVYTRVITHDTVLGRRYRTRDPFEYRETVLVKRERHPFVFQKIIVGDTIACFNLEEESACFIRFTELAEEERAFFESMWYEGNHPEEFENCKGPIREEEKDIPVKTRLFSKVREFFLSYRGLIGLSACAVLSGILTGVFFWQLANMNLQNMREQLKSIAATGALQFNTADLDQLRIKADITKPEYAKAVGQLNAIRNQNPDLVYAYILRPTIERNVFEYVADADSLHPDVIVDVNKDGKIDEADDNVVPGEKYTAADDLLNIYRAGAPAADSKPYTDKWGTFIDGAAPIRDKDGNIHALLGVNKWAKDIYAGRTIKNILTLFSFLFLFSLIIWLTAFDRSLLKEIKKYMKEQTNISSQLLRFFFTRRSAFILAACALIAAVATFALYENDASLNLKRIQDKVLSIAATGALQFDAKELDQLHTVADITKPEYAKVIYLLNAIRQQNDGVKYAYVMRPTNRDGIWEFVADADSLDPYAKKDLNGDGAINEEDHLSPPGETYDAKKFSDVAYKEALQKPVISGPANDQWGNLISGWAPIKNASGSTVAIFGVDKFASDVNGLTSQSFKPIYYFLIIFLTLILIRLAAFNRSLLKEMYELVQVRKIAVTIGLSALASLLITLGLYEYTQHLILTRMQDKVVAIASTAAPQFDPKDINGLQVEDDWKKPEWNRMENLLVKIKKENQDVMFAYIFRKTKNDPQKMEFVGDADSINPLANTDNDPTNDVDMNHDGKIDGSTTGADYETWPGQPYPTVPSEGFDAYNGPTATKHFYTDHWGSFISGYAPIKDESGKVVAILAIDMSPASQKNLTREVFTPIYVFIIFFALFLLFRMKGFSKSLLHQLMKPFRKRISILITIFTLTLVGGMIFATYEYTLYLMEEEIGTRLMSIAATAAPEFNADDLNQLHRAADMKKDAYQRVFKKLNGIRKRNEKITYAYIERPTEIKDIWEFVSDADSNYYIPFENTISNNNAEFVTSNENVYPGEAIDVSINNYRTDAPFFDGPTSDQWGIYLSGYAPIRDNNGDTIALLGLDMDVSDFYKIVWSKFSF